MNEHLWMDVFALKIIPLAEISQITLIFDTAYREFTAPEVIFILR